MIKNAIANSDGNVAQVDTTIGEIPALVVATRPLKTFEPRTQFFVSDTYGRDMNKNAAFGGTPILIHDGTDNGTDFNFAETGTTKWTEDSTDRFHAGSKSLKCDNSPTGSYAQFTNPTGPGDDITLSDYVGLTMWINVDKEWQAGDSVTIQAVLDGSLVGNVLKLEDYFDWSIHDVWHFVFIPYADIATATVDAFRLTQSAKEGGLAPTFYIDEWQIEQTGTPVEYSVKPNKGCWFHAKSYQTTFVDAFTGLVTTADGTESHGFPGLSYNKLLGMTTTEGYVYSRYRDGELISGSAWQINTLADLLNIPNSTISNSISDGTNTLITVSAQQPDELILKSEENDELRITIRDDFSALLQFRICVMGYEECR